jgi:hypothetical protein
MHLFATLTPEKTLEAGKGECFRAGAERRTAMPPSSPGPAEVSQTVQSSA